VFAAKAVAYSDPTRATSGKHFDSVVLPALGIADQVRAKAKLQTEGSAAEFVRRGEADIAVQQVSELLPVEGVSVIGLLPQSLQKVTIYSAAVATKASSKDAAQKLLAFLTTPASRAVFKSKGMDAPL
jgi:molybdate transport system substrate-binding protein